MSVNVFHFVCITVPQTPVGFRISDEIVEKQFINVILSWDPAEGLSSEVSVDYYLIVASPSQSESINVTTSNLSANIILSYNTEYNISLYGINCAGVGPPITKLNVLYGKM